MTWSTRPLLYVPATGPGEPPSRSVFQVEWRIAIAPINGRKSMGNWGYNPYKWTDNPAYNWWRGPPCRIHGTGIFTYMNDWFCVGKIPDWSTYPTLTYPSQKTSGFNKALLRETNRCSLREGRLTSHYDLRREDGLQKKLPNSVFFPNGDLPLNLLLVHLPRNLGSLGSKCMGKYSTPYIDCLGTSRK